MIATILCQLASRVKTTVGGFLKQALIFIGRLYQEFLRADVFLCAQAIGFKGLVALLPALIVLTGLLAHLLTDVQVRSAANGFIHNLLPSVEANFFASFLEQLIIARHVVTTMGTVALVLSLLSLMTSLRVAVERMFVSTRRVPRPALTGYLFDLRMVIQIMLLMLFTFSLSSALYVVEHRGLQVLTEVGWIAGEIEDHERLIGAIVGLIATALMLALLYYFVPVPHPPLTAVVRGALAAAVLWELCKYGFTLYAVNIGHFHRYDGATGDLIQLAELFGLILAYVLWVYLSGSVLCVGALITLLCERRINGRLQLE